MAPPAPGRLVGPCFNSGQLGHLKLHCPKLPRQQYPLHVTSRVYVDNVNPPTTANFSGDVIDKNVDAIGTARYDDNNNREGGPTTNFDTVRMSEGNMTNNYVTLGSVNADLVTHILTGGDNINTTTDKMCTGSHRTENSGASCHFTHSRPVVSVNEPSGANMCTQGPSSCGMLVVDGDRNLQRASANSCSDVESMKPDRGLDTPDPLDSALDSVLPDIFWEVEQGETQVTDVQGRLKMCLSFWENKLDPAPWIISCIREGYKLPLRSLPSKFSRPNQQSALDHKEFL